MGDISRPDDRSNETRAGEDRRASSREDAGAEADGRRAEDLAVGTDTPWPLLVIGGASIVGGIAALLAPVMAGFAAAIIFGVSLIFCGGIGTVVAFRERGYWHMAGTFAVSVLAVIAGAVMLLQPAIGIVALGTLIIAWLAASGFLRLWYGFRYRSERKGASGWMMALGAASLLVALLLWFAIPYSIVWLPGVVLGIDLMIWGAFLVALGWSST